MSRLAALIALVALVTSYATAEPGCGGRDPQTSIRTCTEIINSATDAKIKRDALGHRTLAFLRVGDADAALKDALLLKKLHPEDAVGHGLSGLALVVKSEWQQAIPHLDEAIRRNTTYPFFFSARGRALLELERYNDAIQDFDIALKLNPDDRAFYGYRAIAYSKTKRFDQALADINYAIWAEPKNEQWYFVRAEALTNKGDIPGALKDLEKVLSLDPQNFQAKALKGALEFAQKLKRSN